MSEALIPNGAHYLSKLFKAFRVGLLLCAFLLFFVCAFVNMAHNIANTEYFDKAGVLYEVSRQNQRGIYAEAARVYADRYSDRHHPERRVFQRMHRNALAYGSFRPPRTSVERENPNTGAILAAVAKDPHTCSRAIAFDLNISQTAVMNVLHKNQYKPYKVHIHQELTENDHYHRLEYCLGALQQPAGFFSRVLFSDESSFSSDGTVNRHNSHYWSPVNPHWMIEQPMQGRWYVDVWCGIVNE